VALPVDYDSPAGEEQAEFAIREALGACFLVVGAGFGFTSSLVHTRPRYPRTTSEWETVGTIEDPDTTGNDTQTKLVRYCSFKFVGLRRLGQELTLRYQHVLSFGFKDTYASNPSLNSHDQMTGCAMQFSKYLSDNLNLGLDDRVTHRNLEYFDSDMIPADKQGEAAVVLYGRIDVVLNVCH